MSPLFFVNILALFFSVFVFGALIGVVFARSPEKKQALAEARRRLRVLMFGWEFPPFNSGGLGVACLGIVRALFGKNVDVVFVMPKRLPDGAPYAKFMSAEDVDLGPIVTHAVNSTVTPYMNSSEYACYADGTPVYGEDLVSEARRYARAGAVIAAKEPHDLIYAHDWFSFGAGRAAKRVSNKPFIAHVHSTEFDRTGGENVNQDIYDLERGGFHEADRVVAVSERTKRFVVDRYSVPGEKVRVAWNGIDEATAPAPDPNIPSRLGALKDAGYKIVLFLGRITIQKGPDYFVRAARRVIDRDPNVLFVVAGSGNMERDMMHLAASLGIADKVLFSGFLRGHDQYEAYKHADLFVAPSVSEPFGLTVLEAMRIGTPVIVSKQSGVAEAVENAVQVDFWDVEKLADAMLEVLDSPSLRRKLIAGGKRESALLSWDRTAENLRGLMDELAAPA